MLTIAVLWMGAIPQASNAARSQGARLMVSATVVETCSLNLSTEKRINARNAVCTHVPTESGREAGGDLLSRSLFNTEINEQLGLITLTF
jgi:hypothetical protein